MKRTLTLLASIAATVAFWFGIHVATFNKHWEDKGIIMDKFNSNRMDIGKYSADVSTHLYLVVKYDRGKIEQTEVNADTWYRYKVGERIDFVRDVDYLDSTLKGFFEFLFLCIADLASVIYTVMLIIAIIKYLWATYYEGDVVELWD